MYIVMITYVCTYVHVGIRIIRMSYMYVYSDEYIHTCTYVRTYVHTPLPCSSSQPCHVCSYVRMYTHVASVWCLHPTLQGLHKWQGRISPDSCDQVPGHIQQSKLHTYVYTRHCINTPLHHHTARSHTQCLLFFILRMGMLA